MEVKKNMVEVREAHKKYGQAVILNGLNMTVPKGNIYGLLGPSGCGKTTLLGCIVGKKFLDSGAISLGVNKKKHIGYMPQEVALFEEFKIQEIFQYYGRIFGLNANTVNIRTRQLIKILELPNKCRVIGTLSGGQQRRVSLAVCLLHNPALLILDEPTVGLDPILCHNVWEFLLQLANVEGKTIIITTHYIEEARHSHIIGLLREGVLLVEEAPNQLLASQNSTSLEEVFLNLSKKQQYVNNFNNDVLRDNNNKKEICVQSAPIMSEGTFKFNRFSAQLIRNMRWTYRNIPMFLFMLSLPIIQSFLYSSTFGKDPQGISVALVSEELSSLDICDRLSFNVTYSDLLQCNVPFSLTCQYVNHLASKANIVMYSDIREAKTAVARNQAWGVLHINENFTNAFLERINNGFSTNDFSIDQSIISVWLDMTDFIIASKLKSDITESLIGFVKDILEVCGLNPELGDLPIKFNEAIYGAKEEDGIRANGLPGFVCAFVFYMPLTFTSSALMMDKTSGLMDRTIIAGLTKFEMITAHLIVQLLLGTVQTILIMVICYVAYAQEILGDYGTIVLILYLVMFVGITFGFLLAEFLSEDSIVTYAGIGTILTIFFISGIIWPREGSHMVVRWWAKWFPVVAAVESYSSVTIRGFPITHPLVYPGLLSSIAWVFVFSFLTYLINRKTNK